MSFVEISRVSKQYGQFNALRKVNVKLRQGDSYVLRGVSGSGKSTLLYLLAGLDRPTEGTITVDGKNISKMNDRDLACYRNEFIGLVFQFHFLLPSMNCLQNILLPSKLGRNNDEKRIRSKIIKMSNILGVEHCLDKFPYELSGGEQQRINVLRALSLGPKLVLCDEPTGSLDSLNSERVVRLIKELVRENNSTLVVATHDERTADHFSHILHIEDGFLNYA